MARDVRLLGATRRMKAMVGLAIVVWLAVVATIVYVAAHFIIKFW